MVGGAGRMGRRLCRFFRARGHAVAVLDPAAAPPGFARGSLQDAGTADVVVVAVSLARAAEAEEAVLDQRPRGLVLDIASVKAPLLPCIARARREGVRIASVHPMFGPERSFRGRDLLICDTGDTAATARARRLFSGAGLVMRALPVGEHDRWIARTLGLAHLVALVVASSLAESGIRAADVAGAGSTSFRRLLSLLGPILEQEPELTRAIQSANPESPAAAALLASELEDWRGALFGDDGLARFQRKLAAARAALAR